MAAGCFAAVDRLVAGVLAARSVGFCVPRRVVLVVAGVVRVGALGEVAFVLGDFLVGAFFATAALLAAADVVTASVEAAVECVAPFVVVVRAALAVLFVVGVFFTVVGSLAALRAGASEGAAAAFLVPLEVALAAVLVVAAAAGSAVRRVDCRAAAFAAVFLAAIGPSVVTPSTLTSALTISPVRGAHKRETQNPVRVFTPREHQRPPGRSFRAASCVCRGGPQPWLPSEAPAWAGSWALESRSCSWVSM